MLRSVITTNAMVNVLVIKWLPNFKQIRLLTAGFLPSTWNYTMVICGGLFVCTPNASRREAIAISVMADFSLVREVVWNSFLAVRVLSGALSVMVIALALEKPSPDASGSLSNLRKFLLVLIIAKRVDTLSLPSISPSPSFSISF